MFAFLSQQVGGEACRRLAVSFRVDVAGGQPPPRRQRRPQGASHRPRRRAPAARRRPGAAGDHGLAAIRRRPGRRQRQRQCRFSGTGRRRHASSPHNSAGFRRTFPGNACRRRSLVLQSPARLVIMTTTSRCGTDSERPHRCCHLPNTVKNIDCGQVWACLSITPRPKVPLPVGVRTPAYHVVQWTH